MQQSNSLKSAAAFQIAIIDCNLPLGQTDKWLLLEWKLLLASIIELHRNEFNSFATFDDAKCMKGVKIIGCVNEKSLVSILQAARYWRALA